MEKVLILCAHPDDEVFGVGGTISKYIKEGKSVTTVIFSYGENSMPWLKPAEVRKIRQNESLKASKILGTTSTFFLGLKEGEIDKVDNKNQDKLKNIITTTKPSKIFTHSQDDPHIDHRAVNKVVSKLLKEINFSKEVYAFEVWNPFALRNRNRPKLYVDISKTFNKKMEAVNEFKTQRIQGRWPLTPAVFIKALVYGLQNRTRYAERFLKIEL